MNNPLGQKANGTTERPNCGRNQVREPRDLNPGMIVIVHDRGESRFVEILDDPYHKPICEHFVRTRWYENGELTYGTIHLNDFNVVSLCSGVWARPDCYLEKTKRKKLARRTG